MVDPKKLEAAARAFLKPYEDLSDEFVAEVAKSRPDSLTIMGSHSLTQHTASAIRRLRDLLR